MKSAVAASLVAFASSACAPEQSPRLLVVDERIELCAASPYAAALEDVQATQWRVAIEVGEYSLPPAQPLPDGDVRAIRTDGVPVPSLFDVRDVDGASSFDSAPEGAVVEHANLSLLPDEDRDVMLAWSWHTAAAGPWSLSLALDTEAGDDFRIDGPRNAWFSYQDDVHQGSWPNRSFDVCAPASPTIRTRVTLDRGEVVLDVRYIERDPQNGDPHRVIFVASEVRIDDVEIAVDDFFRLLHSATSADIGDGAYAVLAPELEAAELGCGIAVMDIGTAQPQAFTIDCALRELEALAITDIARDLLPAG